MAMYSASVEDSAMVGCFLELQSMRLFVKNHAYPKVE